MSVFSKKNIRIAAKDSQRIPLDSRVITTSDFGFSQPIYCREVVSKDKWNIDGKIFCRLSPMPVPVFAKVDIITRAFYVRMRNVWKDWEYFHTGRKKIDSSGAEVSVDNVPYVSNSQFVRAFCEASEGGIGGSTVFPPYVTRVSYDLYVEASNVSTVNSKLVLKSLSPYETVLGSIDVLGDPIGQGHHGSSVFYAPGFDWSRGSLPKDSDLVPISGVDNMNGEYHAFGFNFTHLGRHIISVSRSLGVNINWTISDTTPISLLPFLAYCRTWYDYVLPSKYSNNPYFRSLFEKDIYPGLGYLRELFDYMSICMFNFYDNDYFTGSWETPFSPIKGAEGDAKVISDYPRPDKIDGDELVASFNASDGPRLKPVGSDHLLSYISQYALDSMRALYSWGTRRGLAGNKYFEQVFSTFGIKLPNVLTNRCEFLGSSRQTVQVSDVMSTAQTDNNGATTALGDYAGKGISYGDGFRANFEADEFGYVIVTMQVIPNVGYTQGRHREVMHVEREHFFDPNFDCLGMQAVRNDELFSDFRGSADYDYGKKYGGKPDGIFGYAPRFTEYKCGRDLLNGDFRIPHMNTGLESYHTFRMFSPPGKDNPLANVLSFRSISPDLNGSDFDRIFNITDPKLGDHFYFDCYINASAQRAMKSVQDSIELQGGQTVSVDPDNNLSN